MGMEGPTPQNKKEKPSVGKLLRRAALAFGVGYAGGDFTKKAVIDHVENIKAEQRAENVQRQANDEARAALTRLIERESQTPVPQWAENLPESKNVEDRRKETLQDALRRAKEESAQVGESSVKKGT